MGVNNQVKVKLLPTILEMLSIKPKLELMDIVPPKTQPSQLPINNFVVLTLTLVGNSNSISSILFLVITHSNSEPISVSDVVFGSMVPSIPLELITYGGPEIGTVVLFSQLKWITNQVY